MTLTKEYIQYFPNQRIWSSLLVKSEGSPHQHNCVIFGFEVNQAQKKIEYVRAMLFSPTAFEVFQNVRNTEGTLLNFCLLRSIWLLGYT